MLSQTTINSYSYDSQDGSPLPPSLNSFTFSSLGNMTHSVKCPITQTQQGKHTTCTFTRQDPLMVQVGVIDSTSTLPVIPTLEMRQEPVNITGLDRPHDIAVCDNGDIVVTEQDAHCVTILNREGKKLKLIFGTKQVRFTNPYGVAISSDRHILVTDKHRLQKLQLSDGKQLESSQSVLVTQGARVVNHNSILRPDGIAVHPTIGHIFVADSRNNRIQVFINDLTFSHTITPSGQPFNHPRDIALDNEGYLYVVEWGNHCIKKLYNSGKNATLFGSMTHGFDPTSLAIHNNLVYVCEACNNRVSVYDTDGKLIRHIHAGEKGTLVYPYGIAVDSLENVYISDFAKKTE